MKPMVVSQSRSYGHSNCDLTLHGEKLGELKSLRILGVTFDFSLTIELFCEKLCQRQPEALVSCAGQECNLIFHVCSKAVSMRMFRPI